MYKNNEVNWPSYISEDLKNHFKSWLKLDNKSLDMFCPNPEDEQKKDTRNVYNYNSLNFRSPNFFANPDMIAIGCSQTWGVGVPDETVWPAVLARKSKLSYVNLGLPGASIYSSISSAMAYIEKYGKPKYIFGLLPDFRRLTVMYRPDINTSRDGGVGPKRRDSSALGALSMNYVHFPHPDPDQGPPVVNYSKKPHSFSDVLSLEVPLFLNVTYLNLFQKYCETNNIELYLSSWDDDTVDVFRHLEVDNFFYKTYERDTIFHDYIYSSDCHADLEGKYADNWYRGADHTEDSMGHIGVHRHLDYAEMFADRLRK